MYNNVHYIIICRYVTGNLCSILGNNINIWKYIGFIYTQFKEDIKNILQSKKNSFGDMVSSRRKITFFWQKKRKN